MPVCIKYFPRQIDIRKYNNAGEIVGKKVYITSIVSRYKACNIIYSINNSNYIVMVPSTLNSSV